MKIGGEIIRDDRSVERKEQALILTINQQQVYNVDSMRKIVKAWKDKLARIREHLGSFDVRKEKSINDLDELFRVNKEKMDRVLGLNEEEHLKEIKKLRTEDLDKAKAFLEKYDSLLLSEKEKMAQYLEGLKLQLEEDKEVMEKSIMFWDMKEYLDNG